MESKMPTLSLPVFLRTTPLLFMIFSKVRIYAGKKKEKLFRQQAGRNLHFINKMVYYGKQSKKGVENV
jgi:hypothetical protein